MEDGGAFAGVFLALSVLALGVVNLANLAGYLRDDFSLSLGSVWDGNKDHHIIKGDWT